jgi:inhibitor of KinA sporulation pathway (predicted exonuclease)
MNHDCFTIIDIETNVEESSPMDEHFHVIQIGAIKITNGDFDNPEYFSEYIRPVDILQYPSGGAKLTDFIKKLTKIQQEQVDTAETFPMVWKRFLKFCDPYFEFFVSWGKYDWDVLEKVCNFYNMTFPWKYHVNIKEYYKAYFEKEEVKMGFGVKAASEYFKLPFNEFGAHNGLEDAKMISAIAKRMTERGFHTFKKAYYEFREGKVVPCKRSPYLINPVLVKKYKEIQKQFREMESFLFSAAAK